jgi:uncharacterized protein involved in type VI secretion and phage assembly
MSLLDAVGAAPKQNGKILGVVTAVVTNNQDPDKLGRVKLKFPWLSDTDESWWARVATPMAGKDRGLFLLPEVNDEVLVLFEQGDLRFPYVIGALWNGNDTPPLTNEDGKNDQRMLKSRSGHMITLDDKDGEEQIQIVDKSGKNSIVITSKDNKVTITADADITITSSNGKVVLSGNGVEIKSQADVKVEASGNLELKGSKVNVNNGALEVT